MNPVGYRLTCGQLASLARNPAGFNAPYFCWFKWSCSKTEVFKQLYY
jgi:hypothetical protein